MKIAVCSTSRNRPRGLIGLSHALHALSSGDNEIGHFIRCDTDDVTAYGAADFLHPSSRIVLGPRTATLGGSWNASILAAYEGMPDWEAMTFFPDDVLPLSLFWDRGVQQLIGHYGKDICAWQDQGQPDQVEYFILSRKYVDALGGKLFTDYFPFWFDDTWLSEVNLLAFGKPMDIISDMRIGGRPGPTTGMRELRFWVDFWIATRVERIEWAARLRQAFAAPEIDTRQVLESLSRIDALWEDGRIPIIEQERGEKSPPDQRYIDAKANAEQWLSHN